MIIQAGDHGIEIDTGDNRPGVIQTLENGQWQDYLRDGKPVMWPVEVERLDPGRYRLKKNPGHG